MKVSNYSCFVQYLQLLFSKILRSAPKKPDLAAKANKATGSSACPGRARRTPTDWSGWPEGRHRICLPA
ncbi:MAG TPA: hypothetical protein VF523_09905, partial [Burkholderiales bacterium]